MMCSWPVMSPAFPMLFSSTNFFLSNIGRMQRLRRRWQAHNMLHPAPLRRPHLEVPAFWSSQFGVNIKSVGAPIFSDKVVIAQGLLESRRFVAVYGRARFVW